MYDQVGWHIFGWGVRKGKSQIKVLLKRKLILKFQNGLKVKAGKLIYGKLIYLD